MKKKTIAHYSKRELKIPQRFIYNQMMHSNRYRSIVIGPYERTAAKEFPMRHFYNLNKIKNRGAFFKKQNVVAIHAHHGGQSLHVLPIARKYNIPLIVHFRGRDASAHKKAYKRNRNRYKKIIKYASLFVTICDYLARELVALGFPKEKIVILRVGIDTNAFPFHPASFPRNKNFRILTVSRLVEKKGTQTLVKAFKTFNKHFPKSTLHIIGDGELRGDITRLIKKLNLNNKVKLLGEKSSKEIATEMHNAHIFCLASQMGQDGDVEGCPNAIKEAMATGIPVVATTNGGIPEMIEHKKSGFLSPEKNPAALAKGFLYFAQQPNIWKSHTLRAREIIEKKFDLKMLLQKQEKIYDRFK